MEMLKYYFIFLTLLNLTHLTVYANDQENFVYINRYSESTKHFKRALKEFFRIKYESDQPISLDQILTLVEKCNPDLSLKDPQTFKNGFDVCMDFYYFSLWTGLGNFDIDFTNSDDQTISINGGASFIGGQLHIPKSLDSRFIIEGKYWYFPSLATSDSISQDLNNASFFQGILANQKRWIGSDWSYRIGLNVIKAPIIKNTSESILIENLNLKYRTAFSMGPLIGFKFAFDRSKWIKHLAYLDFSPLLLTDSKAFHRPFGNYSVKLDYKYFIHKRWALTFGIERTQFMTKEDILAKNLIYGLGIQLYTF